MSINTDSGFIEKSLQADAGTGKNSMPGEEILPLGAIDSYCNVHDSGPEAPPGGGAAHRGTSGCTG